MVKKLIFLVYYQLSSISLSISHLPNMVIKGPIMAPILSISMVQVKHELERLVRETTYKADKRRLRLEMVCLCMGEQYVYIESLGGNTGTDDSEKRKKKMEYKSNLTNLTCNKTSLYRLSMIMLQELRDVLYSDFLLKPLMENRQIMIVLKGGNAQKAALKRARADLSQEIETSFGLDGDNDLSVLIDPSLSVDLFDECHDVIMARLVEGLENLRDHPVVAEMDEIIKSLIQDSVIVSKPRRDLSIKDDVAYEYGIPHEFYISRCDKYDFNPEQPFSLVRFMRSYVSLKDEWVGRISSEILDVSVMHQNNVLLQTEFERFRSLEYAYITGL
jgi:hypothetical protein